MGSLVTWRQWCQNISTIVYRGFDNVTSVMSKHINDSIWGGSVTSVIVDMFWHHWRHATKPSIYYRWYVLTSLTSRYQTPHILPLICFDITDVALPTPPYTIDDLFWHNWHHFTKPMKNLHRFTSTPKGHIHIYYRWFVLREWISEAWDVRCDEKSISSKTYQR
jgi:hypothetical protein